jgi:hypothetical protein
MSHPMNFEQLVALCNDAHQQFSETLSRIFTETKWLPLPSCDMVANLPRHFSLGWSQYVEMESITTHLEEKRDAL